MKSVLANRRCLCRCWLVCLWAIWEFCIGPSIVQGTEPTVHSKPILLRISDEVREGRLETLGEDEELFGNLAPVVTVFSVTDNPKLNSQRAGEVHTVVPVQFQAPASTGAAGTPAPPPPPPPSPLLGSGLSAVGALGGLDDDLRLGSVGLAVGIDAPFQSKFRATTDAADMLGKTPAAQVVVQKRSPIVTDPRPRNRTQGQVLGSGSFWVPARMDLDTLLSKIDSRILGNLVVINGPYSAQYGPGFSFIHADLLHAPRYSGGFELHGNTSTDFKTNGEQWYGRQTVLGGHDQSGFRIGYGHRTGNDYTSGDGTGIPSSYKSRDVDVAYGVDLANDSRLDFNYLRLDQTDVELPGQAFDIDVLVTDAYDLDYVMENGNYFDRFVLSGWYNRTWVEGSAGDEKQRQFPFFRTLGFEGSTDVDSMSTGYRAAFSWGEEGSAQLTAGADLRYVKQELNELTSGFDWDRHRRSNSRARTADPDRRGIGI